MWSPNQLKKQENWKNSGEGVGGDREVELEGGGRGTGVDKIWKKQR